MERVGRAGRFLFSFCSRVGKVELMLTAARGLSRRLDVTRLPLVMGWSCPDGNLAEAA